MQMMNNPELKNQYVRSLDSRFSADFVCDLIECQPGEAVLRQGEDLAYLYFLLRGKVKIFSTSMEGKGLIVAFNRPIQLFGDIEFLQQSAILNTVEALGTVHLLRFSIVEAKRLQVETAFNEYLLDVISRKFFRANRYGYCYCKSLVFTDFPNEKALAFRLGMKVRSDKECHFGALII